MTTQISTHVNGVNVDQLVATVGAIQENPEIARFQFRAQNEWIDGSHSRTTIQGFYGALQENDSRYEPFIVEGDEPPVLLGGNTAPNAVEMVLHALAACLTVGFVYNAAAQGINIESLGINLEGDLDLQGMLGLSKEVRPGFENIHASYRVKSDAPQEKIKALVDYVQTTSPVLDIIRKPVPVSITLAD